MPKSSAPLTSRSVAASPFVRSEPARLDFRSSENSVRMPLQTKHVAFPGRLVIVGFGSIGQGVLPLLLRHIEMRPDQIVIVTAEPRGAEVASEYGIRFVEEALTRENYRAVLAERLGVKVIHIAERDTQVGNIPKQPGEFVNTWSIDGFFSEGSQPAELGWGTHERHFPVDAKRHDFGSQAAIYLMRPGAGTRVRSWTPLEGSYLGFLITHGESISIADYLTVRDGERVRYRPTCHYAYHPCDDAVLSLHELAGKNFHLQSRKRLMVEEITTGIDELGVLLLGPQRGVYWYGSRLSIDEARRVAPHNNATSLQVTAAVLAGVIWAIEHPARGIVEPEELDIARILEIARPYLGELVGVWGDWTPLQDRERLFPEDLDRDDPWQFKNIRVV